MEAGCISPEAFRDGDAMRGSRDSCTHVENVRGSVGDCGAAAGEPLELAACGDVAVVSGAV